MILKKERYFNVNLKKISRTIFLILSFALLILLVFKADYIKINLLKQKIKIYPEENFFLSEVELSLKSPLKNAQIYYTVDGSNPTSDSYLYTNPLKFSQTTVLKLAIFKNNNKIGEIQTKDIFINSKHELPVISISTNPDNLWNENTGIYTEGNFSEKGSEWERPAYLSFYESDKTLEFVREIGLRLHGYGTRGLPQKSFRIYLNNLNKNETLKYPLFPDNHTTTFNSFVLRNAGGDWSYAFLRDALMQEIVEDSNTTLDLQDYRPVVLYLNGSYWGLYNLRERQDKYYLANKYKADPKEMAIFEIPLDIGENRGKAVINEGNDKKRLNLYHQLLEEASKCNTCVDYNHFNQFLDIENFIDYLIVQFHYGNSDWPYGNSKFWSYKTSEYEPEAPNGLDGRFRWLVYDLDTSFGIHKQTIEEVQDSAKRDSYETLIDDRFPFRNFFNNFTFKTKFLNRYADFLNTIFNYENVESKINLLASKIETEIPRELARWHDKEKWDGIIAQSEINEIKTIKSYEDWQFQIELLKAYAKARPDNMKNNTVDYFKLSGLSKVSLDINNPQFGQIKVNTITVKGEQMPWSGEYFNDVSLNITAIPEKGYKFIKWEGYVSTNKESINIFIDQDINLKAIFE